MPTFSYTARDSSGQSIGGSLVAESVTHAIRQIRGEGRYPVSIRPAEETPQAQAAAPGADIKISRAAVIHIANQLSVMVETGVTLADALDCISHHADSAAVRQLVADLSQQLQAGSNFSDAVARHPRSFPTIFVALMKAAEKTGMLSRLLNRATAYLRQEQETLRRVRGALTYPGIMFAFAVCTTIFLLTCVLPRFTVIYAAKQAALPLPTQALMGLSDLVVNRCMELITVVVFLGFAGATYLRTEGGRRVWHYLQLNVPLFGSLFRKVHLSRGLHMVGTMAGAGVNLMDCVATACDLCTNTYFRELWQGIAMEIQAGRQLSDSLFRSPLVPGAVAQMIYSGEKSGKLAMVMEQVSGFAEQELKEQTEQLTRYIEPAMICVMGAIIGGVSLAMLLPVFTISRVMAH